jgi:uncharacterized protein YjbI with pentapeptide repeats
MLQAPRVTGRARQLGEFMRRHRGLHAWGIAALALFTGPAEAAEMTAREVTELLFKAEGQGTIDLSKKDLAFLDLSGINFKRVNFEGANLHGVVFSDSNLEGANLKGAVLNLATLSRTNFTNADLEGASLLRVAFTASLEPRPGEAPRFTGANLKKARLHSRLDYTDFTGADLTGAKFGPEDPKNELLLTARPVMNGANFTNAILKDVVAANTKLRFARMAGADLTRTDFTGSDLTRVDFTGADVSGANFSNAILYGANFSGVRGLDTAKGLDSAIDYDKALQ